MIVEQIWFSVSSGMAQGTVEAKQPTPLLRCDSQRLPKRANPLLGAQQMASWLITRIRRQQTNAFSRWKRHSRPDPFLMDAVYVLAWQRSQDRKNAMVFALRYRILPLIRRAYLRKAFQQWRYPVKEKPPMQIIRIMEAYQPDSGGSLYSMDSRSSIYSEGLPLNGFFTRQSSSIGEHLGSQRKEEDNFYFIKAIKHDADYLSSPSNVYK